MKNKLILMLKTLFASKGFSQKALEGLADILVPNLTEESTTEDLTAAIEGLKPMTDIMQSEISRQVSEAKKPVKVEEPAKPVVEEAKPVTPAEDMPEWAKALVTSTQALAQGLQAIQTEKVGNTRRDQWIKSMEGTSKEYQERELKKFDLYAFKDDDHFNEVMESMKGDHASAVQEETNNGLGGERPVGGLGKPTAAEKEVSPAMKELIAERTAQAAAKTAQIA